MSEAKKEPLWVQLAFSSIPSRKMAIVLIWSCILFSLYCLPWTTFTDSETVASLFLIDDWSWAAMMLPICAWYILSLRWMDTNNAWDHH